VGISVLYLIYFLKKAEYSQAQIAEMLERNKSTISRELRRNRVLEGYRPLQFHNLALMRHYDKLQIRLAVSRGMDPRAMEPGADCCRLDDEQCKCISHERIYQ